MHIFASGPELQAVRFGYVILGENGKIIKIYLFISTLFNHVGQLRTSSHLQL